ncbi:MAG: hypothetical protein ACR2RE_02625 [Geminicoccaceae bacterium]
MVTNSAAGALDLNGDRMAEQTVEQRRSDGWIAEDLAHSVKPQLLVRIVALFSSRTLARWKKTWHRR